MLKTATAINEFSSVAHQADCESTSEEPIFTFTAHQLSEVIAKATAPLREELQDLKEEVAQLREDREKDRQEMRLQGHRIDDAFEAISDIDNILAKLTKNPATTPPAPGSKTEDRISQLKTILKSGPRTFGELERLLKISPREMLRITKRLDMRCFEITRRPGDSRQKVLRLRSQIRGP